MQDPRFLSAKGQRGIVARNVPEDITSGKRGSGLGALGSDGIEYLEDGDAQCVGDHLHSIDRGIGLPPLNPAQVGLVEATALPELDLAQPLELTQFRGRVLV